MKQVILDHGIPLGTTPNGSDWCGVALNPSTAGSGAGCPDLRARPFAHVGYQGLFKLSPPPALNEGETWDCDLILTPDPICFATWAIDKTGNYAGSLMTRLNFATGIQNRALNGQISGLGNTPEIQYAAKVQSFVDNVENYRLSYYGATLLCDAPALANQGTLTAVQMPYECEKFTPVVTGGCSTRRLTIVPFRAFPDSSQLQTIPGAMVGKCTDGAYIPFKLSEEDMKFRNCDNLTFTHTDYDSALASYIDAYSAGMPTNQPGTCNILAPTTDFLSTGSLASVQGGRMIPRATTNVGMVCLRGMGQSCTLQLTIRCGFEYAVYPNSIYSPFLTNPAPYDAAALEAYFAISHGMAQAYPAEYNDMGKMLELIGSLAETILPVAVPQLAPLIPMIKGAYRFFKGKSSDTQVEKSAERAIEAVKEGRPFIPPKNKSTITQAPRTSQADRRAKNDSVRKLVAAGAQLSRKRGGKRRGG